MDITESQFFFIGKRIKDTYNREKYDEGKIDMASFAEMALTPRNPDKFVKSKELMHVSNLNSTATGSDIYQYSNQSLSSDIMSLDKNDPIMEVINELLNSTEYKESIRRTIMLILYEKGFYPKYSECIRLPSDVTTQGTTHKGEPVRTFIDMDITQCKLDLEEGKEKLLENYPELEGVNFENLLVAKELERAKTILNKSIDDSVRWDNAKKDIEKLRELWKKVTTGPDRNYPLSHFIQKYDIINATTLTRTKKTAMELLDKILGSYHNSVLGLNSYN